MKTEATHGIWYSPEHKHFQIGPLDLFTDADAAVFRGPWKVCEDLVDTLNSALLRALAAAKHHMKDAP